MRRSVEKEIPRLLLEWYRTNRRDLPWRKTKDPYRTWVAEIMLQQTRVDTVIPYYERFLERFPDVIALARARLDMVLKSWEGLGYYSRARHLHEAAGIVARKLGGNIPDSMEELRKLPGVGAYTAGAILSIAFGRRAEAVDGNVNRVIARLFAIEDPVDRCGTTKRICELAARLVPDNEPGHYNQALMDLGSGICTPRSPNCPACPLSAACRARAKGLQESIPSRKARAALPHREAVAALLRNDRGQALLVKRPERGLLGGLWRFPGGLLKEGEAPATGLRRMLREELGLKGTPGKEMFAVEHEYSHFSVTVHVLPCTVRGPIQDAREEWIWSGPRGFSRLALSRIERKILGEMQRAGNTRRPNEDGKRAPKRVP